MGGPFLLAAPLSWLMPPFTACRPAAGQFFEREVGSATYPASLTNAIWLSKVMAKSSKVRQLCSTRQG
jgi:hypothetical protein